MKEHPILMSGPLVRATLADLKTQTRRLLTPQPRGDIERFVYSQGTKRWFHESPPFILGDVFPGADKPDRSVIWRAGQGKRCPFGVVGDRLWVRETWARSSDLVRPYVYAADPHVSRFDILGERWTPSIFMPRRASRLTLEVTSIRVERLQDISGADVLAIGFYGSGRDPERGWVRMWWIAAEGYAHISHRYPMSGQTELCRFYFTMVSHPLRGPIRVGNAYSTRKAACGWMPFVRRAWLGLPVKIEACWL